MTADPTQTTAEAISPVAEDISVALIAAFNAGYDVGRKDGAATSIATMGDAPDRATRRREWLARLAP